MDNFESTDDQDFSVKGHKLEFELKSCQYERYFKHKEYNTWLMEGLYVAPKGGRLLITAHDKNGNYIDLTLTSKTHFEDVRELIEATHDNGRLSTFEVFDVIKANLLYEIEEAICSPQYLCVTNTPQKLDENKSI